MLSWDTSNPNPDPAITKGITRDQPESALGTIGISNNIPIVRSANPDRTMLLGLRFPALLPASSAIPNMLSESGAMDRPASMALYSSTICR